MAINTKIATAALRVDPINPSRNRLVVVPPAIAAIFA
jgi:hypothetical protein